MHINAVINLLPLGSPDYLFQQTQYVSDFRAFQCVASVAMFQFSLYY